MSTPDEFSILDFGIPIQLKMHRSAVFDIAAADAIANWNGNTRSGNSHAG
jgi:hypothetical protein